MKYTIVTGESFESEFVVKVNKLLQNGWKLQGGVSISIAPGNYKVWSQALIKEND